jgi:hypothetical protein
MKMGRESIMSIEKLLVYQRVSAFVYAESEKFRVRELVALAGHAGGTHCSVAFTIARATRNTISRFNNLMQISRWDTVYFVLFSPFK